MKLRGTTAILKTKHIRWGRRDRTRGAYMTWRGMCASGSRTCTAAVTTVLALPPIPPAPHPGNAADAVCAEAVRMVPGHLGPTDRRADCAASEEDLMDRRRHSGQTDRRADSADGEADRANLAAPAVTFL